MKLSYRGSFYSTAASTIETTTETTAKYRGIPYQVRHLANAADVPPGMILRFRGAAYSQI